MRIVVILNNEAADGTDAFLVHFFSKHLLQHHQDSVIFIHHKSTSLPALPLERITHLVVPKNRMLSLWYSGKIRRLIKKHQIDLVVSTDAGLSFTHPVKQFYFISNESFIKHSSQKNNLSKADQVIAVSEQIRDRILGVSGTEPDKIVAMSILPETTVKLTYSEKQLFYDQHTEGQAYFLCLNIFKDSDAYLVLLKSFSAFKKWNKSGIKLVLPANGKSKQSLTEKLKSYKYRADVCIIERKEVNEFIPAAFGCISMPSHNRPESLCLEALHHQTPLILKDNEFFRSIFGKSVLFAEQDEKNIGKQMILLYKDDSIQEQLTYHLQQENVRNAEQPALIFLSGHEGNDR